jgi:type IV pilus assembly protein PilO
MKLIDELQALDTNDPGRWPLPFRIAAVCIIFVAVLAGGIYWLVIKQEMPILERAQLEETELKSTFEQKQRRAANFDAYKAQLAEIEREFGTMLRQLPGRTEVDSLLVDIAQTALASGLEEELFQPNGEVPLDFYAELPISLRYTGSYHEIGDFVSGVAALPRIVTLHNIKISPVSEDQFDELTLEVTAKTYRYLEEEPKEEG